VRLGAGVAQAGEVDGGEVLVDTVDVATFRATVAEAAQRVALGSSR
jgi:hypothetical protein